jgi:hypothetical protein
VASSKSKRLHDALNRLAVLEEQAFAAEFLAPALRSGVVHVRIAGVICRFKVEPHDFQGWGVFRPASPATAQLVRTALQAERKRYLEALPLVRLIVVRRDGDVWKGIPAHQADTRFHFRGLVPVRLIEKARPFEIVRTRFDGAHCWYDDLDPRRDPAAAAYLRAALGRLEPPEQLDRPGLTAEERTAYGVNYWPRLAAEEEARRDRVADQLRAALAHAGAELSEYLEGDDSYQVVYEVDGRRHVSVVGKNDLGVRTAGICLSGQDSHFDLQSLVGVLREAPT